MNALWALVLAVVGADSVLGQEVEIILGGAPAAVAVPTGPAIRVITYVQYEPERSDHRVVQPPLPEEVLFVQQALAASGYDPGARDGMFGVSTETALTSFQEDRQLTPCGCVDYATIIALGLTPSVTQTVIGAPNDASRAEVLFGNSSLPSLPEGLPRAEAPPETVTVVQQVADGWWGYAGHFLPFRAPPFRPGSPVAGPVGFPFGGPASPSSFRYVRPPPR